MALVSYSDSDTSDIETEAAVPALKQKTARNNKPLFGKVVDQAESGTRKIKLDLPKAEPIAESPGLQDEPGPPQKKSRTTGAFSGFNSLLPAPKRVAQTGPKLGVNLKTSSEAAFSRGDTALPVSKQLEDEKHTSSHTTNLQGETESEAQEPKIIGKSTRFMPLSVASNKRKPKVKVPVMDDAPKTSRNQEHRVATTNSAQEIAQRAPMPKRSLFLVTNEDITNDPDTRGSTYEPIMTDTNIETQRRSTEIQAASAPHGTIPAPNNSLETVASDLNLTPAQRRQLFGRKKAGDDVQIAHFDTEAEYASNEQLRMAGEAVEHKAVKAIAPGKHSLQQLVNNAKSQQDAMEEKWAAGRSARGEGGSKYGF